MDEPKLTLVFNPSGGRTILKKAVFDCDSLPEPKSNLAQKLPKTKTIRALCIFLLLAKHREKKMAEYTESIPFVSIHPGKNWIRTIGEFCQGKKANSFFATYFEHVQFFTGTRGSLQVTNKGKPGQKLPSVTYHLHTLKLNNVEFKMGTSDPHGRAIGRDELVTIAENLENFEIGKKKGWLPIVRIIESETDKMIKPFVKRAYSRDETYTTSEPTAFHFRWNHNGGFSGEVGNRFLEVLDAAQPQDTWLFISSMPFPLDFWNNCVRDQVERLNIDLRWIFHSPQAACKSKELDLQLMKIHKNAPSKYDRYQYPAKTIKDIKKRLKEVNLDLKKWVASSKKTFSTTGKPSGTFDFYTADIVHPFAAFLSFRKGAYSWFHPNEGTFCLLQPYPMGISDFDNRKGLYLEHPNVVLDEYHGIITNMFKDAKEGRHFRRLRLGEPSRSKLQNKSQSPP